MSYTNSKINLLLGYLSALFLKLSAPST